MIIGKQITVEANDIRESWELYEKYMKEPMDSNFEGIFANINKKEFYRNELYWSASKIKRVINGDEWFGKDYRKALELAIKIQIAALDQNIEFLNTVSR